MKNFTAADDDSTRAILLDPAYMKGWSRRGMTRYRRGKYAESVQDFEEALRLDPENREVAKLIKAAKKKYEDVNGELLSNQTAPVKHNIADEVEEKPFKRFEIIEDDEEEEVEDSSSQQSTHDQQFELSSSSEKPFTRFEVIDDDKEEKESRQQKSNASSHDKTFTRFEIIEEEGSEDEDDD
ncbi:hypothetical protein PHPALM_30211 [Phytophthora palmivora]|uniref:Uncharacterized protein n=1 Tax=Phytophthora palmivora TaxID=4796 RepID=A0A2P4X5P4_9STRA|nr:hypothetical protein PHPALM_30211 [Phytophthora palmivora]